MRKVIERRLALEEASDDPSRQRIRSLFEQVVGDVHDGQEEVGHENSDAAPQKPK